MLVLFDAETDNAADLESAEETDDVLYCATCGHLVTRRRWAIAPGGDRERVCANPAGRMFVVISFTDAPGAADLGPPTEDYSWFKGYAWNFAHCRGCNSHLGWRYTSNGTPPLFWGLIKDMLTTQPR